MSGFSPPKNKNLTIEQFWPLNENKSQLTDEKKNALKEAQQKALAQLKSK